MTPALPLLLLLLSSCSQNACAGDVEHYITVATSSLKPKSVCAGHRGLPSANHTWVPLNHPDGPCSELGHSTGSFFDMLRWDKVRADEITRKLSNHSTVEASNWTPATSKSTAISGSLIKVALPGKRRASGQTLMTDLAATGGGEITQTMVLDTASDVAWVQCVPCPASQCYPQTDVLYDPANSGTYAPFSCNSPTCRQLGPYANGCSTSSQCQYRVQYPDGSSTTGTYISDVLTITPTAVVPKFQFGCSHAEQGSFNNQTAGIMALGRGAQSLVSQTKGTYGNVFSYCVPPTPSYYGFFTLGTPRISSSRFLQTPMLRSRQAPSFYLVRLQAITVAGQRLNVPPTVFAAGAVMDSRTAITRLPPTAYQALRSAFRDKMRMYRAAAPKGQLDTCYDFSGMRSIKLPRITLVFDRTAGVELDPSGVLLENCLAFTSSSDDLIPGIIGNVQQQTLEVLYDVDGAVMGFRRGAC